MTDIEKTPPYSTIIREEYLDEEKKAQIKATIETLRRRNNECTPDYRARIRARFTDSFGITDPLAPKWTLNDFDIGRKLGSGQFGSVYLARERRTGYIVAIKAIKKASLLNTGNEHLLRREIEIHSHLIHPNILGFFGWFITKTAICLIIEVAPKGELMDKLSLGGLREPIVSRYMFQMISAIRACHKMNVIHRDLKPENILIDLDGRLKLADFGWAAHIPEEPDIAKVINDSNDVPKSYKYLKNRRKTYCGTMDYLSPEIVRQEWYGKEVDIWCLGILCFELATGGPPFKYDVPEEIPCEEEKARRKQQYEIQYGDLEPKLLPFMSAEICDFLRHTLEKNPDLRMTPYEMLRHPFITKYNAREIENELYADTKFPESETTAYEPDENTTKHSWRFSRLFLTGYRANQGEAC